MSGYPYESADFERVTIPKNPAILLGASREAADRIEPMTSRAPIDKQGTSPGGDCVHNSHVEK